MTTSLGTNAVVVTRVHCSWNVLLDSARSNRQQLRAALVDRELERHNIQTTAQSETRLAEEGEIKLYFLLRSVGARIRRVGEAGEEFQAQRSEIMFCYMPLFYSRISMARTSLGPWKFDRDMGSTATEG